MITLCSRGRAPIALQSSSTVLIFFLSLSSVMVRELRGTREIGEPGPRRLGDRFGVPQRRLAPVLDLPQDAGNALLEADPGLPAQLALDLADVGEGAIGLARPLGNMDLVAAEELDEAIDRLRAAGAEVVDLAHALAFRRREKGRGDVGGIEKVAALAAVADHGEGLAGELLAQEHAEDGAVGAGGARARAVGVEDAD